jgi:short-subunit dehydrogenase
MIQKTVVITGASSGLGAALSKLYAKDDARLFLCARRAEMLEQVANVCRESAEVVECAVVDVRCADQLRDWIDNIVATAHIDLVIVNSGKFGGNSAGDELESQASALDVVDTNLGGAINTASAIIPSMQSNRAGRIAFISSLSAIAPQADAPAYSASKAGLSAYGKALREFLLPFGVGVTLIHPGHIDTPQTHVQNGPLPGLMSAEASAEKIKQGLSAGRSTISFPLWLRLLITLENLLPWRVQAWINRFFRFTVEGTSKN